MHAIYLTDLALRYFPRSSARSAVTQLRRWIVLNEELQKRLEELHYKKGQRTLTPLQHEAICHYLGEPDRKSTRLNSSHMPLSRMPSSA